jgi:hypothetical protein
VDGEDLREASHERAVEVIRKAGNRVTFLVQSLVDFVRFDFFKFVSKVCFKTFQLFFFLLTGTRSKWHYGHRIAGPRSKWHYGHRIAGPVRLLAVPIGRS